jgi:hypothetical protein
MVLIGSLPVEVLGGPSVADWLTAGATAALALGVAIAAVQLFDGRKARDAEFVREMSERWDSKELVETREAVRALGEKSPAELAVIVETARGLNDDSYYLYLRELNFFEDLGVLYRRRIVAVGLIESALGTIVCDRWTLWKPHIDGILGTDHPTYYENFQILALRISDRRTDKSGRLRRALAHRLLRRLI